MQRHFLCHNESFSSFAKIDSRLSDLIILICCEKSSVLCRRKFVYEPVAGFVIFKKTFSVALLCRYNHTSLNFSLFNSSNPDFKVSILYLRFNFFDSKSIWGQTLDRWCLHGNSWYSEHENSPIHSWQLFKTVFYSRFDFFDSKSSWGKLEDLRSI